MNENIDKVLIFSKIDELKTKLKKNQQLQTLAKENGIDIKNSVDFTDDTINNIIVSIVSLYLSKMNSDERYNTLTKTGLQKRSLKTEIINDYKNQANQLLNEHDNEHSSSSDITDDNE